jgi:hypothetical protein
MVSFVRRGLRPTPRGVLTPLTWHSCPLGVHVQDRAAGRTRFCYSTNSLAAQNSRRSMNWIFRDEPSPVGLVFSSLVMTPKLAGSEISDAGSP